MCFTLPVTVLVGARNEARNIRRCISSLSRAARVVVIDSHSTDDTAAIAASLGAEVVQFNYAGGYPKKRQWALNTCSIATEWTLLIDADECVTDRLWCEMASALDRSAASAFLITKQFHFLGRRFTFGGFSHSAVLLFRTGHARFESGPSNPSPHLDMEVHERLLVDGTISHLKAPLLHEDFKGLESYIAKHNHYSTWEAQQRMALRSGTQTAGGHVKAAMFGDLQQRRRFLKRIAMALPCEHHLWFLYHFVIALGFLEGRRGLIAAQLRASYIRDARAKVFEASLDVS